MSKRIAITLGDPGAIGPDMYEHVDGKVLHQKNHIVITDPKILVESANKLNIKDTINELENLTSKSLREWIML